MQSDRCQALASHHFLVEVAADTRIDRGNIANEKVRYDLNSVRQDTVKDVFSDRFADLARDSIAEFEDCDKLVTSLCSCLG